jgi:hypothetical protein
MDQEIGTCAMKGSFIRFSTIQLQPKFRNGSFERSVLEVPKLQHLLHTIGMQTSEHKAYQEQARVLPRRVCTTYLCVADQLWKARRRASGGYWRETNTVFDVKVTFITKPTNSSTSI